MGLVGSSAAGSSLFADHSRALQLKGLGLPADSRVLALGELPDGSKMVAVLTTAIVSIDLPTFGGSPSLTKLALGRSPPPVPAASSTPSVALPPSARSWTCFPQALRLEVASISVEHDVIYCGVQGSHKLCAFSIVDESLIGQYQLPDSFEPQRQNHQGISFSGFSSSTPPLIPLQQLIDQSHHLDGLHHHSQANHHSAPSSLPPGRHLAGEQDGDEKSWRRLPSTEPNADLSAGGRGRRFWNKILVLPGSGDVLLAASCGRVGLFSATERQLTDALVPQSSRTAGEPLSLAYCRRRERAFVGYSSGLVASFALGKTKEWTRSSKEGGDEGEVEAARRNRGTSGREEHADVDDDDDVDDVDDKHDVVDDEDGKRERRELVALAEFKGHTQAVLYVDIPHRFEVLLTGSKDGTVRQWHPDLAREIKGYSIPLFAAALCDPRRSVLVVGTSAGSLFSYQLERAGTGLESFFTAKGISPPVVPFPGVNPPVDILSYLSSSDSLLLGSSVPGCHALHCRPFLNKPITENSSSSHSSLSSVSHPVSPLFPPSSLAPALPTSDPIKTDGVLHEMQSRVPPSARVDDMTHFQAKRRLLPLFLSLYETPSSAAALELQNAPDRIEKELHVSLLSRYAQQSKTRKGLLEDHRDILDPEHTVERIRTTYQRRLELLQERHRLELAELEEDLLEELAQFRQQLPSRREHLAQEYLETRETACRFEQFIDKAAASKLNECLRKSHPVISERYMVGKKIRSGVSSVFLGIDLHVMRHVAIKAVASFIPINTGLQHPGLCPILDVLKTPGTTFLVLPHLPSTLASPPPLLSADEQTIARLIHGLLSTIHFLGTHKYVFRDLRPSNVLLDDQSNPLLLHLGIMRAFSGPEPLEGGTCFASPEVFCGKVHATSDVFSIGVLWAWLFQTPRERAQMPLFPFTSPAEALWHISSRSSRQLSSADVAEMCKFFDFSEERAAPLVELFSLHSSPTASPSRPPSSATSSSSVAAMELTCSDQPKVLESVASFPSSAAALLSSMLEPNPLRRITPYDALHSSYFQRFGFAASLPVCSGPLTRSPSGMITLDLDSPRFDQ